MVLGILSSVLIVRQLTAEEYGFFSYLLWLFGILGILGTLAFPNGLTRLRSELLGAGQHSEAQALSVWVVSGLFVVNLIFSGLLLAYALLNQQGNTVYLVIMALALVPSALASVLKSFSWGGQRYSGVALASSAGALAQFALILISYRQDWRVPGYLLAFVLNILVQFVLLLVYITRPMTRSGRQKLSRRPAKSTRRSYLSFSLQATLVLMITTVVWERSELFFLQRFSSLSQVGYYNLAFTSFSMFFALGWSLINGFYPALSTDYGASRTAQLRQRMVQGIELSLLFGIPISFGGMALLRYLIPALYGADMSASVQVAQLLYVGLAPGVLAGLLNICFTTTGHIRIVWILGFAVTAVNVALNLILTPPGGALGAAIANTTSQLFYAATMLILVVRHFALALPWRRLAMLLIVGGATCFLLPTLVVAWLGANWVALGSAVVVAAGGYLLALAGLGYVDFTTRRAILRPGRWLQ